MIGLLVLLLTAQLHGTALGEAPPVSTGAELHVAAAAQIAHGLLAAHAHAVRAVAAGQAPGAAATAAAYRGPGGGQHCASADQVLTILPLPAGLDGRGVANTLAALRHRTGARTRFGSLHQGHQQGGSLPVHAPPGCNLDPGSVWLLSGVR